MQTIQRAHTIRLNPTPAQAQYFRRAAGIARFAYNWGLAEITHARDAGQPPATVPALRARFNAIKGTEFPWVANVTKCAAEGGFANLRAALHNYGQSQRGQRRGRRMGFPRFKAKRRGDEAFVLANDKFTLDGHAIRVPRLGWVNMAEPLRFAGRILGATIRAHAGWWWVSIRVVIPHTPPPPHPGHPLGIDVGIKTLAVDSDGEPYPNLAPLRRARRQLRRLRRALARRQPDSANYHKAADRLARAHYRVACRRADSLHKTSAALVAKGNLLGIETLNVAGMLKNRRLARALSDAGLSELHRQIRYKAKQVGAEVIAVGRFFPSSQLHHGCGGRKADLTLAERIWICPRCGAAVERDLNAARNIRDEALRLQASR